MSVIRSLPILVSVLVSTGFYYVGSTLMPARQGGGYAAIVCAETVPDRQIRERLEARGFSGIISESGQWVLVDNFGSIDRVPLDEYTARLLPFDPRNDGYAEKLHSLFVRDGQRFIYIPLAAQIPAASGFAGIEKKIVAALDGIPYSFYYTTAGWPPRWYLALFCAAAVILFFIRPLHTALFSRAVYLLPLLPALAPLALAGAAGFAMASLLAGCAAIFAGPWLDWRLTLVCAYPASAQRRPPAFCRLLPPIFVIFYAVIAFFSGFPLVFIAAVSAFFCVLTALQIRDAYRDEAYGSGGLWGLFRGRRDIYRFSFVPILSRRPFPFAFSWAMLPFAVTALALAVVGMVVSAPQPAAMPAFPPADTLTEADYYRHYWFQSTFSLRSLHEPDQDMGNYELSPDGLLVKTGKWRDSALEPQALDVPPFPLGDLAGYLNTAGQVRAAVHTLLAALLPLLFVLPILFRGREERGGTLQFSSYGIVIPTE